MTNVQVIFVLERIAMLLEIKGENSFKVRAYRTAAEKVENLNEELSELTLQEGGLRNIEGFGSAISDKVTELLTTGELTYLQNLEAEVPPSLLEIMALPGVGPKTAALLWKEGGVTNLEELDKALRENTLVHLPRMGEKGLAKIRIALDELQEHGAKERRDHDALIPLVEVILEALRAHPDVKRAEVAGSFRRQQATSGDLDFLVLTDNPRNVLLAFGALPQVERIIVQGGTKCSVLIDGLQVDCRAVAEDEFGAALQYFTGSRAHNVRLRARAQKMGLTLNEYGLFRLDTQEKVAGRTEEDVYAALGLDWINPAQRLDKGEIERASRT